MPGLPEADAEATEVALEWRQASSVSTFEEVGEDRLLLGGRGAALMEVRRDPAAICLDLPEAVSPESIVHPVLTPPIAVLARWRGDLTLHAGAFVANDLAWGVVGEREAGKSTMLAKLANQGCLVLADDLLVLNGTSAYAGPACVDLRPDIAESMPGTSYIGEIGGRPRHRLTTPQGPSKAELGGFFLLSRYQGAEVDVERMDAQEALKVLYAQEYIGLLGASNPERVLDLLGTPMWRVRRPENWQLADEAINQILEIAGGSAPTRSPAMRPA